MSESIEASISRPLAHTCAGCGTSFPLTVLSCPRCHKLVHAEQLKRLSALAAQHAAEGNREAELSSWRSALELLPTGSRQHAQIAGKVQALVAELPEAAQAKPSKQGLGKLAALGGIGLLLWKFKWLLALLLTKGKLLLLGLTKMSTLFSMLLSLGVYWSLWGWKLALGVVLSIYVHEMGHVAALKRLGIAASAPMFVPGLGAFIRSKQYPASPEEDAAVGLGGPVWGLGAALACYGIFLLWDMPFFAALARVGAWINLFNLLPIWTLDGGRGFRALSRKQRWVIAGVILGAWFMTGENLLLLLLIAAGFRAFAGDAPARDHRPTLVTYAVLVVALAWLATLKVPVEPEPVPAVAVNAHAARSTLTSEATGLP
jgi:Zn-dependent protease